MDKHAIVENLKSQLREQYKRTLAAVQEAAAGATGEDAKAESKYDTRGLELSYLAAGQVEQADRLAQELRAVEAFHFPEVDAAQSQVIHGSLIEANMDGRKVYYLLAPGGGGITVSSEDGELITVLGFSSPLTGLLLECTVGDLITQPPMEVVKIM